MRPVERRESSPTAWRMRAPRWSARPIAETIGAPESRGATVNGAQLHSVRLPGFVSAVEVTFGLLGERLILRHESLDATLPYIGGTLLAIRAAPRQLGLVRGLDSLL